jgi:uridine phosphorylase
MTDGVAFPNFGAKHSGTPLITPGMFLEGQAEDSGLIVPECVIMGYSPTRLKPLLLERGFELVSGYPPPWRTMWLQRDVTSHAVGVVGDFGIGAPAAAMVMEELAYLGVRRIISLGMTGALSPELAFGDIALCTSAIRDEGVSHHYLPSQRFSYPTKQLTDELRGSLIATRTPFVAGPSWTIDAIYRETREEAEHYLEQGVTTVEMEAAALFSVATVLNIEVASLFTVSDHLLGQPTWQKAPDKVHLLEGFARILDVALMTLAPGLFDVREIHEQDASEDYPFA